MQLIHFNRHRASAQTTSHSTPSKLSHTLTYRGVSYEVQKHNLSRQSRTPVEVAHLLGNCLIYRGAQYTIASATVSATPTLSQAQHLIYRGVTYKLQAV